MTPFEFVQTKLETLEERKQEIIKKIILGKLDLNSIPLNETKSYNPFSNPLESIKALQKYIKEESAKKPIKGVLVTKEQFPDIGKLVSENIALTKKVEEEISENIKALIEYCLNIHDRDEE